MRLRFPRAVFAALALISAISAHAEAGTLPGRIEFAVLREGQPFGRQSVVVSEEGGALVAETSADLRAGLGPLTFFHYVQHCTEHWRDGALTSLSCVTGQNGRHKHIAGGLMDGVLRMQGSSGALVMPQETLPTSWWTRPPLATQQMVNTDTGARLPVRVAMVGREILTIGGVRLAADHIRVQGTLTVDLWYDAAGHWVNCAFIAEGQHMTYRLLTAPSQAPS